MPDDPGKTPTPRPRRRRTDIDPTFVPPKVPRERRRSRAADRPPASDTVGVPLEPAPQVQAAPPDLGAAAAAARAEADAEAEAATELADAPEFGAEPGFGGAPGLDAATDLDAAPDLDATAAPDPDATDLAASAAPSWVADRGPDASGVDDVAFDGPGPWLPMFADRSPDPAVCPFLRAADGDRLGPPVERPDAVNRCAALAEAVPQSLRQQELVCLATGHVNCPRYLRGAAETAEVVRPVVRPGRVVTPAILASILVLVGAFVLSIGFVASRGGLELAGAPGASPSAAGAVPSAVSTTAPSTPGSSAVVATPSAATPSPIPTATPSPSPTATPSPSPTATPSPTPTATPKPTARPTATSDRYAVLVACPNQPDCWIYTVRSGDNLYSIANWFGVPLGTVYAMNPWLESTGLRAGQKIELPPPTR